MARFKLALRKRRRRMLQHLQHQLPALFRRLILLVMERGDERSDLSCFYQSAARLSRIPAQARPARDPRARRRSRRESNSRLGWERRRDAGAWRAVQRALAHRRPALEKAVQPELAGALRTRGMRRMRL